MGMTFVWEVILQFNLLGAPVRETLVAASVALAMALAGYFKKENVLPVGNIS